MPAFDDLSARLKRMLSPARYRHSLAVADLAAELGRAHGWDPNRARLVGLLHDVAKEWPPAKFKRYVKKHRIKIPGRKFVFKCAPNMMHAYVGAHAARRAGWLTRKREWRAVESHTLGRKKMTLPEKIIYVADLAAPGRGYPEAEGIRRLALEDIHQGFAASIALKMDYQLRRRKPIHPYAVAVWNRVVCGV